MKRLVDRRYRLNKPLLEKWKLKEGRSYKWLATQIGMNERAFYAQLAGEVNLTLPLNVAVAEQTGLPEADLRVEVA